MKVNCWTYIEAMEYNYVVFKEWKTRSEYKWKLDLRALNNYGFIKEAGGV
jgi:hypothetical protein